MLVQERQRDMAQLKCKCGEELIVPAEATQIVCPNCNASYRVKVKTQAVATQPPPPLPTEPPPETRPMPNMPMDDSGNEMIQGIAGLDTGDSADVDNSSDAEEAAPPPLPKAKPRTGAAVARTSARPVPKKRPVARQEPDEEEIEAEEVPVKSGPSKVPMIVAALGALMGLAGLVLMAIPTQPAPVAAKDNTGPAQKSVLKQKLTAATEALMAENKAVERMKRDIVAEQQKAKDLKFDNEMLDRRQSAAASSSAEKSLETARDEAEEERRENQGRLAQRVEGGGATELVAKVQKAVVIIRTDRGSGSGFIVESKGIVVTNYHVIEASNRVTVNLQKSDSTEQIELKGAKVIAAAPEMDLALVQLPNAPEEVGADGIYPTVELRSRDTVIGESVFAIGAPGFSTGLLDYTVTAGIVSNSGRQLDAISMIQTTAPVNPGNSGGPLFDAAGTVIGVVSAKSLELQSVSFAIPMDALRYFLKHRADENFAVTNLREWEKTHNPAHALQAAAKEWRDKAGFVLSEPCSKAFPSPDGKMLYLLFGRAGKIQEYVIDDKKLGRTFNAGFPLNDAALRGSVGQMVGIATSKRKLVVIDSKLMALSSDAALRSPALAMSYLGGPNEYMVLTAHLGGTVGEACLVDKGESIGGIAGIELPPTLVPFSCASTQKFAAFLTINADEESIALRTYPAPACMKLLDEWAAARRKTEGLNDEQLQAKLTELGKKLETIEKKVELKGRGEDAEVGPLLFLDDERLIVGRRMYKLGAKLEAATEFEPNPLLKDEKLSAAQRSVYARGDIIHAVSPDGKWACSSSHVYNASTGKIVAKLPFLVTNPVFSKDGKSLFTLDGTHHCLFRFVNWEKALAPAK